MQKQQKKYYPFFLWLVLSVSALGLNGSGSTLTEILHAMVHLFDHHTHHHHLDHQLSEQGHTHSILDSMIIEQHHGPSALPILPSDDLSPSFALLSPSQICSIDLLNLHLDVFDLPNYPSDRYLEHRGPPPKLTFTDISITG